MVWKEGNEFNWHCRIQKKRAIRVVNNEESCKKKSRFHRDLIENHFNFWNIIRKDVTRRIGVRYRRHAPDLQKNSTEIHRENWKGLSKTVTYRDQKGSRKLFRTHRLAKYLKIGVRRSPWDIWHAKNVQGDESVENFGNFVFGFRNDPTKGDKFSSKAIVCTFGKVV